MCFFPHQHGKKGQWIQFSLFCLHVTCSFSRSVCLSNIQDFYIMYFCLYKYLSIVLPVAGFSRIIKLENIQFILIKRNTCIPHDELWQGKQTGAADCWGHTESKPSFNLSAADTKGQPPHHAELLPSKIAMPTRLAVSFLTASHTK